jgi:DNA-directed RNA polymerase specialized sigma24 family protein
MDVNNHFVSPLRPAKEKRQQKYLNFKLVSGDEALLELLPQKQRELLTAEGSYQDIAARFGLPIGTVRSRLHRARVALVQLRESQESGDQTTRRNHQ